MCIIHPSFNIILPIYFPLLQFYVHLWARATCCFQMTTLRFQHWVVFFTGRFHEFLAFIYMFVLIQSVLFCIRVCHGCSRPNLLYHGGRVYIICYFSCVSKNACLRGIDRLSFHKPTVEINIL